MPLPGTLHPIPPYDLNLTLGLLSRYAYPIMDTVHDGRYWRALRTPDGMALLNATQQENNDQTQLKVELVASQGKLPKNERLLNRIARILNIYSDLQPFYTVAKQDKTLWAIIQPLLGLRWLCTDTVFEALMLTIVEQQIAWTAAQRAQHWLLQWGNQAITHEGHTYYAFPSPEQMARATIEDLRPLKITFKRMNTMITIAQQIITDQLDLEAIRGQSLEAAYKSLTALKGIGHWTATWTLQRTFGQQKYVGHNDVALQAAVNHYFYGGTGRIPAEQVTETYAQYGEYAGIAANYTLMRYVMDRYEAQ